jgi:uncharacterized membrane protein (DUF2068 family)
VAAPPPRERDRVVTLIAVFKFVKAALLVAAGVGALELMRPGVAAHAQRWVPALTGGAERRALHALLSRATGAGRGKIELVGIGAFAYAALFLTEGVGLWLQRRWAEYLTVVATGSLIPFELYELWRGVTVPKLAGLALNLAVVAYLVWRLRHPRGRHGDTAAERR